MEILRFPSAVLFPFLQELIAALPYYWCPLWYIRERFQVRNSWRPLKTGLSWVGRFANPLPSMPPRRPWQPPGGIWYFGSWCLSALHLHLPVETGEGFMQIFLGEAGNGGRVLFCLDRRRGRMLLSPPHDAR